MLRILTFVFILGIFHVSAQEFHFGVNVAQYERNAIEEIDFHLNEFSFAQLDIGDSNETYLLDVEAKYGLIHTSEGESNRLSISGTFQHLNEVFDGGLYRLVRSLAPSNYTNNDTITASIRKNDVNRPDILSTLNISIQLVPVKHVLPSLVTFIIKTHERPQCLELLLNSIREFYKDVNILVADDGKKPNFRWENGLNDKHYKYVPLSYDMGLSASRNVLVDMVRLLNHFAHF